MTTESPSSRELARRLVARAAAPGDAPDSVALAVHAACERTYRALTRSFGPTGSRALLTRARAQTQGEHPLVKEIRIGGPSEAGLDGVTDLVQTHGAPAVAAGLEAVLERLLGVLGRLIGNDMVARLVEQIAPMGTHDDEGDK